MTGGLTGIANRRNVDQTIKKEWPEAQRTIGYVSLIMINIVVAVSANPKGQYAPGPD